MLPTSRRTRALTILIFVAFVVSQLVAFAPGHSDDHTSHCCPVCHASHAPLLAAASHLTLAPPSIRTCWRLVSIDGSSVADASGSAACTRGPPSDFAA
jgi:hypothetical protein